MSGWMGWFIDHMASEDIIEGRAFISDLVDIELTDEERTETAHYDALASESGSVKGRYGRINGIPRGKVVK